MLTKHNNIKRILAVILAVLALVGGLYGICRAVRTARAYDVAPLTDAQLTDLDLTGITHLMIVAHPDDETLWGGAHIADGGYLVVCITNGNNPTRSAEFQSVMQASGNVGLILSGQGCRKAGQLESCPHPDPDRPGKGHDLSALGGHCDTQRQGRIRTHPPQNDTPDRHRTVRCRPAANAALCLWQVLPCRSAPGCQGHRFPTRDWRKRRNCYSCTLPRHIRSRDFLI